MEIALARELLTDQRRADDLAVARDQAAPGLLGNSVTAMPVIASG